MIHQLKRMRKTLSCAIRGPTALSTQRCVEKKDLDGFCFDQYKIRLCLWRRFKVVQASHADVIKWKHFPRNWPFVRGIHWSPVNSPHKGQWRGALMFSLICVWINDWVNNREAGDLRRYLAHYDIIVMTTVFFAIWIRFVSAIYCNHIARVCKVTWYTFPFFIVASIALGRDCLGVIK